MSGTASRLPQPRGRGACSGAASARFGLPARAIDGDWLDHALAEDDLPPLRTTVTEEAARRIIARNASPDIPFSQSINPYRGCEHGCIYCYARPTHAWLDLSPGLDFESRLFAKPAAARLLRRELARPGHVPSPIALGTNTDPYQPIEARYRLTRQILEVCLETGHPVTITTKSDRVLADLDLLAALAAQGLAAVALSVTSLDPALSRRLEPRAARMRFASSWIQRVTSVSAGPPLGGLYLKPPSSGGLCDGVTTTPSASARARPRFQVRMACETAGVGV